MNLKPRLARPSWAEAVLAALAIATAILLVFGDKQFFTGDEPRYVQYSRSILEHGSYFMPLAEWQEFVTRMVQQNVPELPSGAHGESFFNGVYLPTLLSPIAMIAGLWGLRAVSLVFGFFSLFALFRMCRSSYGPGAALLATTLAGLTIPLLPYLHLFYMEIYLFGLICLAWSRLQNRDRSWTGELVTAALIFVIPFVHMRGSFIASALFTIQAFNLYRRGKLPWVFHFAVFGVGFLAVLMGLNHLIYGSVTGPVTGALPPPAQWFSYFAMQLFNLHHGLFAYAPIWMIGFAGLLAGAWRGNPLAREGLLLAIVAVLTGVGQDAGESWPARYWTQVIPMLTVGICVWWEASRQALPRLVAVLLILFTLVNTVMFFRAPNDFLENRASTRTYQELFDATGHVHFGVVLPVVANDEPNLVAERNLAIGAIIFIAVLAVGAIRQKGSYAVVPLLLIAAAIDLSRVSVLKTGEYQAEAEPHKLNVVLVTPARAAYVQFGNPLLPWYKFPYFAHFTVALIGDGGRTEEVTMEANQIVSGSCRSGLRSMTIVSPASFNLQDEVARELVVYRSRSWLRTKLGLFERPC
jgi:uncharacterized membrane protein YjdF